MVISGTLLDNENKPLIGGHIQLMKDANTPEKPYIGTITNKDGNFLLNNNSIKNDSIIKITFIGFKTILTQAKNLQNIKINMQILEDELSEVIVTAPAPIKKPKTSYAGAWWILLLAGGYLLNKYTNKSKKVKL